MDRPAVFIPFLWLLFFLAIPLQARQLVLDDNFESHNLSEWTGDTDHFIFSDDTGNTLLQLEAPGAGTTQIQTASNVAYGSWEFFIDQGFDPSNANKALIYLVSDIEDLSGTVNGYALQTGENGSGDVFRLLRVDNGSETEILAGSEDIASGGPFQVMVIREDDGTWHLFESPDYGSEPVLTGSTTDNTYTTSSYFGLQLDYSVTRADKFYFDDIRIGPFSPIQADLHSPSSLDIYFNYPVEESTLEEINFSIDQGIGSPQDADLISDFSVRLTYSDPFPDGDYTVAIHNIEHIFGGEIAPGAQQSFSVENPFYVTDIISSSSQQITLTFTEEVDNAVVKPANFTLPGAGSPDQASQPQPGTILLEYNSPITAGDYELSASGLQSINGWPLAGSTTFGFFIYDDYQEGDLHINEFFYRPPTSWRTAQFDRPRYVEIYNSSNRILNLRNWLLNDENISPAADIPIYPKQYLVLTRGEPVFRNKFGSRNFTEAENFPGLSLTTDNKIVLKTPGNFIADSLHYDAGTWGGNGVALERYSLDVPAHFRDNWGESEDALLGSPGIPNTIQPPLEPPVIENIEAVIPGHIQVTFSAAISGASVMPANFSMNHGISFTDTEYSPADKNILMLETSKNLEDGQSYSFSYENVEDIFGNKTGSQQNHDFLFRNPFRMRTAEVENGHDLLVEFTQPLNVSTVDAADFTLPDQTIPLRLDILNSKKVRLYFDGDFSTGKHTLLANHFKSMAGWEIEENASFDFYVFERAGPGDIIISEFLYNPPDHYPAYAELYNHSNKLLNLKNWELRRQEGGSPNGGIISDQDLPLEPGGYMAVTSDFSAFTEIFGNRTATEMSGFPAFTIQNEGAVRLFDDTGELADSLQYNPSDWGGDGVALERRSAGVPAVYIENWGESPNNLLGTPGMENEVLPDTSPPGLVDFVIHQNQNFSLTFDERLDSGSATNAENYIIEPSVPVSLVMAENNRVTLLINESLTDGQEYQITVKGIDDLFGNRAENLTSRFTYVEYQEARPKDIVINEILYRRLESGSPEFVEILNRSEESVSLSGWTLWDDGGSADIPGNIVLHPDDYLVFTDTEPFASGSDQITYLSGFPSLSNNGDAVVLKNSSGMVIDSVYYQPEWGHNNPGISLERKDPAAVSADPSNWAVSRSEEGSTPAGENSRFEPDKTPPQITFANLFHSDSLSVYFSEFIQINPEPSAKHNANSLPHHRTKPSPESKNAVTIHPPKEKSLQFSLDGKEAKVLRYDPGNGNHVILDASGAESGKEITIEIKNFSDFQGNLQTKQAFPVAQPVGDGDLVFNEIMYNPIADGQDNLPDQTDYIEIYNRVPYALSLEGIFLHDEPDEENEVTRMEPVTTTGKWIPGNGYALLYPESETSNLQETSLAEFFELTEDIEPFSIRFDRSSLSLPQAGRKVYLADSTGAVIDMADYRPEWHNPNLIDTKGISLERIQPDMETNDASNWGSNTSPAGGTPGTENSLYQDVGQPPGGTGISFEPNPFSPDDDGFDDNLFIHYSFDEPDYLLRIRIYDRYGRQVRKLEDSKQAGFQGTVIWDGRTDNGSRNRIGIYIIYAEAYNSSNGKNLTFKETVVLARQF